MGSERRPWRSASVAISFQLLILIEVLLLPVPIELLIPQLPLGAVGGLILMTAELISIHRWGLPPVDEP